ncbi:MAG: hypothetical protein MJE77_29680 [Proteobacteria bacterium]|nr:hypothetical protein [Pseudomonadota bacterium]
MLEPKPPGSADPGIYRINLKTGKRTLLLKSPEGYSFLAPIALEKDCFAFMSQRIVVDQHGNAGYLMIWQRGKVTRKFPLRRTIHQILAADLKRMTIVAYSRWKRVPTFLKIDLRTGTLIDLGFSAHLYHAAMRSPLARADDDGYSARGFTGRVAFACPGRVHTGQHTQHSDLWALLATAFYASSGYLPYGPDTQGADRTQAGFDEVFERFTSMEIANPDCEFSAAFKELMADLEVVSATKRRFQSAADIAAFIAAHFPTGLDSEETGRMVDMTGDPVNPNGQSARRKPAPRRRRLPDTVTDATAPGMVSRRWNTALGWFLVLLLLSVSLVLYMESAVFNTGSGKQVTHRTPPQAGWRLETENACYLEIADKPNKQVNRAVSSKPTSNPQKHQEPTRTEKRPASTRAARPKQRAKRRQKSPSNAVVLRGRSIPLHVDKGVSP